MKRWTETTKWNDQWFRRLPPPAKLFYLYLLDTCDEAGVWEKDFDRFAFESGQGELGANPGEMDEGELVAALGDRLHLLNPGKLLVVKFLFFQQPKGLRENVPLHVKILGRLELHGLEFDGQTVTQKQPTGNPPASHPQPPGGGTVCVNVKVKGKKKGSGKGKPEAPELPPELDTPEFRVAWDDFTAYRSEINKAQTRVGASRTLTRLAKVPPADAILAIYATIENNWTGVDPDWLNRNGARRPANPSPDRNYAKGLELS